MNQLWQFSIPTCDELRGGALHALPVLTSDPPLMNAALLIWYTNNLTTLVDR